MVLNYYREPALQMMRQQELMNLNMMQRPMYMLADQNMVYSNMAQQMPMVQ